MKSATATFSPPASSFAGIKEDQFFLTIDFGQNTTLFGKKGEHLFLSDVRHGDARGREQGALLLEFGKGPRPAAGQIASVLAETPQKRENNRQRGKLADHI